VTDGPDPLGKRALYWMPVDPRECAESVTDPAVGSYGGPGPVRGRPGPAGKRALFSQARSSEQRAEAPLAPNGSDPSPSRGMFAVSCSSCGSMSRVGLIEFMLLHFPLGVWLPLRTYDRWMTCPACLRRTWNSVTLSR
jgi:hypothetical protein